MRFCLPFFLTTFLWFALLQTTDSSQLPPMGMIAWGTKVNNSFSGSFLSELDELATAGFRWVALEIKLYVDNATSSYVYRSVQTGPSNESIATAANRAHQLGLKVFFRTIVLCEVADCTMISLHPSDAGAWFASYTALMVQLAGLAEQLHLEAFSVGLELARLSTNRQNLPLWTQLIEQVREVYSGPLTYSAFFPEFLAVPFWSQLDIIGLDAYFELMSSGLPASDFCPLNFTMPPLPSREEMVETMSKQYGAVLQWKAATHPSKLLWFTEFGFPSRNSGLAYPACPTVSPCPADGPWAANNTIQEIGYSVALQVFSAESQLPAIDALFLFILDTQYGLGHDYCPERFSRDSAFPCSWSPRSKPAWPLIVQALGGQLDQSADGC